MGVRLIKMSNDMYKKIFNDIKIFSSGIKTSDIANDNVSSSARTTYTAFPVLKLVTGGVSSSFFGIIKVPAKEKRYHKPLFTE